MRSLIVAASARLLAPLLLLFSLVLLLRGHHEPGGGFVGGLVAAAAVALLAWAGEPADARRLLRARPQSYVGAGLLVALASGLVGLLDGDAFLTGRWSAARVPVLGKAGTPLAFDLGVYLVVLGTVATIVLALLEADE